MTNLGLSRVAGLFVSIAASLDPAAVLAQGLPQWSSNAFSTLSPPATSATAPSSTEAGSVEGGLFTQRLPIRVPPFHGLEPKLALTYSSQGPNGFVGVGWSLAGFSAITRTSPIYGVPRYDSSDEMVLDGQRLIPCVSGSFGASCSNPGGASGGQYYATKVESYQRVNFQQSTDTWTVWQTDGTRATYSPVFGTARGTRMWGLTSVADTFDNTVFYRWMCDTGNDCYPSSVIYNGTTIALYFEGRPDLVSHANGVGLSTTRLRLQTIDVCVGSPTAPSSCDTNGRLDHRRARSYKITYTISDATSRSLVHSIQQFGVNATLDATGAVTGGTSLPARTMQYDSSDSAAPTTSWLGSFCGGASARVSHGDVDGDGRADIECDVVSVTGFSTMANLDFGGGLYEPGDYNGDGLLDFLVYSPSSPAWSKLLTSDGRGGFLRSVSNPLGNTVALGPILTGDFDGDGRTDILNVNGPWRLYRSNPAPVRGEMFTLVASAGQGANPPAQLNWDPRPFVADFNGDGRADVLTRPPMQCNHQSSYCFGIGWSIWYSTGTGFINSDVNTTNTLQTVIPGDFDGDGLTDLLSIGITGGYELWLSTGMGFTHAGSGSAPGPYYWPAGASSPTGAVYVAGDFNGDGRTDIIYINTSGYHLWLATGTSFTETDAGSQPQWFSGTRSVLPRVADVNGDGKADLVWAYSNGGAPNWNISFGDGAQLLPPWSVGSLSGIGNDLMPTDLNGDGRAELWGYSASGSSIAVVGSSLGGGDHYLALSSATSTFSTDSSSKLGGWCNHPGSRLMRADFNGDGHEDLSCHDVEGRHWVAYSTGSSTSTTYAPQDNWPTTFCSGPGVQLLLGDFDGDGRTDLLCHNRGTGADQIALANGSGGTFTLLDPASDFCEGARGQQRLSVADFNGDGKADLACHDVDGGKTRVALASGRVGTSLAFTRLGGWPAGAVGWCDAASAAPPFSYGSTLSVGDFNGDGLADLYCRNPSVGANQIAFSNGDGTFTYSEQSPAWCGAGHRVHLADLHGVRRDELVCTGGAAGIVASARLVGTTWVDGGSAWVGASCSAAGTRLSFVDANGDGKADALCDDLQGGDHQVQLAGNLRTVDTVHSISNGYGATTTVSYLPASAFFTGNQGSSVPVVTKLEVDPGAGAPPQVTTYHYYGAKYDRPSRRSLGFSDITTARRGSNQWVTNLQDARTGATPIAVRTFLDGALVAQQIMAPTIVGNGVLTPYRVNDRDVWTYEYDGRGGCTTWPCSHGRRRHIVRNRDTFNNLTFEWDYGDVDVNGDETLRYTSFAPNTQAFIVAAPVQAQVFAWDLNANSLELLTRRLIYYDGSESLGPQGWTTPPTRGKPTQDSRYWDTYNGFVSSRMSYDQYGNLEWTMDPSQHVTTTTYDLVYNVYPSTTTNALGQTQTATWSAKCARVDTACNADSQCETHYFDGLCREYLTSKPLGAFEGRVYCTLGSASSACGVTTGSSAQYLAVYGPASWSRTYFDGLGRTVKVERSGPQVITTETAYDETGHVRSTTAPHYAGNSKDLTSFTYDGLGRLLTTTYPDTTYRSLTYDADGVGTIQETDEMGHVKEDVFDVFGRRVRHVETHDGTPVTTTYGYDLLGNLTSVVDGAVPANVWWVSYDSLQHKTTQTHPDSGEWMYTYDASGNVQSQTDAKGQVTWFNYDPLNRIQRRVSLYGTPNAAETFFIYDEARRGYYNIGHATTMLDAGGSLVTNYDALGRPVDAIRAIDGVFFERKTAYDRDGRVIATTYPDGDTVGVPADPVRYDAAGRMVSIPGLVDNVLYDAAGRVLSQSLTNGITGSRAYDRRGRLTWLASGSGTTEFQNVNYIPDWEGKLVYSYGTTEDSWFYQYDDLHRLTNAFDWSNPSADQSYDYDELGRMTWNSRVGTYTYNPAQVGQPHAVQTAGAASYVYDANGSMTSGGGRTYTYDGDGLTSTVSGPHFASYEYDGTRRRLKMTVDGHSTRFPWDDYEVGPSGVTTKHIPLAAGIVAKRVGPAGGPYTTTFLLLDRTGSVRSEVSASGSIWQGRYSAYGERTDGAAGAPELGFIGERQDADTGLSYMHERYYDPVLARFTSPDPVLGQLDAYGYAGGDPINRADPSGLDYFYDSSTKTHYDPSTHTLGLPQGAVKLRDATYWVLCDGCFEWSETIVLQNDQGPFYARVIHGPVLEGFGDGGGGEGGAGDASQSPEEFRGAMNDYFENKQAELDLMAAQLGGGGVGGYNGVDIRGGEVAFGLNAGDGPGGGRREVENLRRHSPDLGATLDTVEKLGWQVSFRSSDAAGGLIYLFGGAYTSYGKGRGSRDIFVSYSATARLTWEIMHPSENIWFRVGNMSTGQMLAHELGHVVARVWGVPDLGHSLGYWMELEYLKGGPARPQNEGP